MKNRLIGAFLAIPFCIILCGVASAQKGNIEGLNFKLGDDVSTVKNALHTDSDPEFMDDSVPAYINKNSPIIPNSNNTKIGKSVINLRTKGIRVFFNKSGIVEKVQINTPYQGSIAGIKIGDPETKVRSVMGKPLNKPKGMIVRQDLKYALDDTAYITFSVDNTNGETEVDSIIISK